jgi:hypothetical protein
MPCARFRPVWHQMPSSEYRKFVFLIVGAFCSRCMNCDPFPSPTITKCSKTASLLGVNWASVGRGAVPGTGTRAQPWGNWQGGQHPSEPAQAPSQGRRTSPKPPDTNHDRGVQSCKDGSLFQSVCQGIQAVVVDHVTGAFSRSARNQQTCNHDFKQAAHQKISKSFKTVYAVRALAACWGLEVRNRANNGQISIWARMCRLCSVLYPGGMLHLSGHTSRVFVFPGYRSKATMLLASESGARRKK